jgi:sterol 24-C-methyltransferase
MAQLVNTRAGHVHSDVRGDVEHYRSFHDNGGGDLAARKRRYEEMVSGYYDLVTDIYERGWGESFHFAPRYLREPFEASLKRHQHFIALRLGLGPGMTVLDIGCGVGGPMREIARFSKARIFGVNNNAYQVHKARTYNRGARLSDLCELLEADFMNIPREDASVDAAYAFEATCHAPDKTALFRELFRVLKPQGKVAIYEWCLTDRFDARVPEHVRIKRDIEEGNGLPDIWSIEGTRGCFEQAGFRVLEVEDRAHYGDREVPWYHSLTGRELSNTGIRRSTVGKAMVKVLTRTLEVARVAPRGTSEISDFLNVGADALVRGGELGIFTPMAFLLAEKPGDVAA